MKYFFIGVFLAVFFVGCRTSEQLIDLAIKRNPAIEIGTNDTIEITQFVIDSFEVVINDSVYFEKIIREIKFDTIINTNAIYIERKKTRQEKRYLFRLEKQNKRFQNKIDKLEIRLKEKTERIRTRNEVKKQRIRNRSWWWIWLLIGTGFGIFINYQFRRFLNSID